MRQRRIFPNFPYVTTTPSGQSPTQEYKNDHRMSFRRRGDHLSHRYDLRPGLRYFSAQSRRTYLPDQAGGSRQSPAFFYLLRSQQSHQEYLDTPLPAPQNLAARPLYFYPARQQTGS